MRLIDAERLECLLGDKRRYGYLDADDICNSPTVEAIPVDWIKHQLGRYEYKQYGEDVYYYYYDNVLEILLEDWEKENETN